MRRGTTPATAAASWRVRLILHRLYSACRASSCRDTGLVLPRKGSSLGMVPASCAHKTESIHRLCISGAMIRLPEQLSLDTPQISRTTGWHCRQLATTKVAGWDVPVGAGAEPDQR